MIHRHWRKDRLLPILASPEGSQSRRFEMKKIAWALALSIGLGCAAGAALAEDMMPGTMMQGLLAGNTEVGRWRAPDGKTYDYVYYFKADGQLKGKRRPWNQEGAYESLVGSWKPDGDKICISVSSTGGTYPINTCKVYMRMAANEYHQMNDSGQVEAESFIVQGNARHL
jgi:hypothetical protein